MSDTKQLEIAGAEQRTAAEMERRRQAQAIAAKQSQRRIAPRKAQKPIGSDGGLFDSGHKQGGLL